MNLKIKYIVFFLAICSITVVLDDLLKEYVSVSYLMLGGITSSYLALKYKQEKKALHLGRNES